MAEGKIRPVSEQVVVVFGASSGIGRETALRFARQGAKVVAAARTAEALESLENEIRQEGGECSAIVADAVDFLQVKAVADLAQERYGRIDTWAHLAAVAVYATVMDTTPEEYDQILRVGLLGQIHGVKAALPHFLRNDMGGALVCVTSVEAVRPLPYHSGYSAAKHGVHGFLQALRLELAHDKLPIRVTEVMPASVDTPFFDKARTKIGERPQGAPPIYPPHLVADEIIRAAGSDLREVVVGGAGKAMVAGQRLSPTLMDAFMGLFGFAGQKTGIPKSVDAPDNLYGPVQGYEQVEGSITGNRFATASRRITDVTSAATKPLRSNPMVTAALLGTAALATAALLANRSKSQAEQRRESRPEGGNGAWDSYRDRLGSAGRMVDAHYGPGRPDPLHGDGGVLRRSRIVEDL